MAPSTTPIPPPVIPPHPKTKRQIPAGIQTNGAPSSSSPSPSMSAKKPPNSASANGGTVTVARPPNRVRQEITAQPNGATRPGTHGATQPTSTGVADPAMMPVDVQQPPSRLYILKKYYGNPPSLIVHLHPNHFKFDAQDDYFLYTSPMKAFLDHLKTRTIPHDMLADLTEARVPFYEGCLIVEVHDHRSVAAEKEDAAKNSSAKKPDVPTSVHKNNPYITPSPNKPSQRDPLSAINGQAKSPEVDSKGKSTGSTDQGSRQLSNSPQSQKSKAPPKRKISTLVLFPTQQSRQADLAIRACNPRGSTDGRQDANISGMPPPTPSALVPPTPTGSSMPPPAAKKVKRERMELDSSNIHAAEGAMLLATMPPLDLEPSKDVESLVQKIDQQTKLHAHRFQPLPQPKTRKRTVAEMAADEAQAAENERFLLTLDEKITQGSSSVPGGDGQQQVAPFNLTFDRFKKIEDIKKEHAEKAKQEKLKREENERRLAEQKVQAQAQQQQQQQQQQQAAAAEQEKLRQEQAAQREQQENMRRKMQQAQQARERAQAQAQAHAQAQAQQAQAQQAQAQAQQNQGGGGMHQNAHGHPAQSGQMPNGVSVPAPNGMPARFHGQVSQPQVSSPVVQQNTPQNMSSPMPGGVAMQTSGSNMGGSPARPPSVVQNQPPMSTPMAVSMSARGSQQSHPSGTPRMHTATPNMAHATPITRAQQMAHTPRMSQSSPPPGMMAPHLNQSMMMNSPGMANMSQNGNPMAQAQLLAQQQRQYQQQQNMNAAMMQNNMMNPGGPQNAQQLMQARFIQQQQNIMRQKMNGQQQPGMQMGQQQRMMQANMGMPGGAQMRPGQNMVNMGGQMFPQSMQQLQQMQLQQQMQQMQQQQQGHPQQMQQNHMMGAAGPQAQLQQRLAMQMSQQVQMFTTKLYQDNVGQWLQTQNLTQETCPPELLQKFRLQCMNSAKAKVMQLRQQQQHQHQQQALALQQQQQQAAMQQQGMMPQGM